MRVSAEHIILVVLIDRSDPNSASAFAFLSLRVPRFLKHFAHLHVGDKFRSTPRRWD